MGFNDPYDCATQPFVLHPTTAEAELVRTHYLTDESLDEETKARFSIPETTELQEIIQRAGREAIETSVNHYLKSLGATCLSEQIMICSCGHTMAASTKAFSWNVDAQAMDIGSGT